MKSFIILLIAVTALTCTNATFAAEDVQTLLTKNNCMFCHQLEGKKAGPSFVDIAKKYKSDTAAAAKLEEKILKGSAGTWGTMPMPAMSNIKPVVVKAMVAYILSTAR